MDRELDKIDKRILDELQADGRLSIVELASRVNLSNTPCTERVRRLENAGYIKKYAAIVDPTRLGYDHLVIVQITMAVTSDNHLDEFNRAVQRVKEVESCLMIAGSFDYVLLVRTRDMAHFRDVLGEQISRLPGIRQTNSFAVMQVVKEEREFQVGD
ncbi:MAG: Lrp/AsnC family transcriptional regulator [Hyphomicrobiales bacterium]